MTVEEKALALVKRALYYADGMICRHDNCERGGVLWTICQDCGAKWADDTGGFKPSPWPEMLDVALADADAAIEAHEADKKAFSDAMRIVQQYVTGDRQWAHGTRTSMIRLADGRKVRFADFIIPDPEPDPLVEAVTVTIRGKGDHRVRLDELARLIRGGARIERIEQ